MATSSLLTSYVLQDIPTHLVEIGERFRKDLGDLTDFLHSVKTQGIISPILVQQAGGKYKLIAGERRTTACLMLEMKTIPAKVFTGELTDLEKRILELAENLQRKEMSWQEEALLKREIHQLQQKQFGEAAPGPGSTTGWRMEDTASMLGVSKASISTAISLADNMERFGGVVDFKKMKTAKEAASTINSINEAVMRQELAKRAEKSSQTGAFLQNLISSYIISDAFTGLGKLQDASFDLAIIDPPYGINLGEVKKENSCEDYTEVSQDEYLIFTRKLLKEAYRILKPNTFCVFWFGMDPWFEYIFAIAREEGFTGTRIPGIWTKPNGQSLNPSSNLATAYETFFIFKKGTPVLAKPGRINIFDFPPVSPNRKYHPTQKPLELAQEVIQTFAFENAKIIVPFLGSGVDILAAATTKRQACGYDLSEEYKGGFIQEAQLLFPTL